MARKKGSPNKTAAIKEFYQENPNASPSEAAAKLTEKGLEITPQYVSTIKSKLGLGSSGNGRRGGRPARAASAPAAGAAARKGGASIAYESLVEAKKFVQSVGDVERARRALDAYASLAR